MWARGLPDCIELELVCTQCILIASNLAVLYPMYEHFIFDCTTIRLIAPKCYLSVS